MHDPGNLPKGFPFTIDELRRALARSLPPDHVTILVNDIVSEAHREVEIHTEIAQHRHERGREPDATAIRFAVTDEILAQLMFASPSTAERVRAIKEQQWAEIRKREIDLERRRKAERAGLIPSLDDILDDAERRGEFSWDDPRVFHGMAVSGSLLPVPPPATADVIALAESFVAQDIAEWEELVDVARTGAPCPWRRAIGDVDATLPEDELPDREPNWEFIDEYIGRYDRFERGYRRLLASIARDLRRFNTELVRALRVAPDRAIPRVIMYHLLGGYNSPISIASPVGEALTAATAGNTPAVTTKTQRPRWYETANLLDWFEVNRERYESYPFFNEWRGRKRTRREVSFMRLVRDRPDEAFPPLE